MSKHIRIVKIPEGDGPACFRKPYVGHVFPLADPAVVREIEARYFVTSSSNSLPPTPSHSAMSSRS